MKEVVFKCNHCGEIISLGQGFISMAGFEREHGDEPILKIEVHPNPKLPSEEYNLRKGIACRKIEVLPAWGPDMTFCTEACLIAYFRSFVHDAIVDKNLREKAWQIFTLRPLAERTPTLWFSLLKELMKE